MHFYKKKMCWRRWRKRTIKELRKHSCSRPILTRLKKKKVLEALAEKDDQRTEESQLQQAKKRSKFVHAGAAGPMRVVKNGFTIQKLQSQVIFYFFVWFFWGGVRYPGRTKQLLVFF